MLEADSTAKCNTRKNTKIDEPKPGYNHFEREESTSPHMNKDWIRVLHGQLLCVVNGTSL